MRIKTAFLVFCLVLGAAFAIGLAIVQADQGSGVAEAFNQAQLIDQLEHDLRAARERAEVAEADLRLARLDANTYKQNAEFFEARSEDYRSQLNRIRDGMLSLIQQDGFPSAAPEPGPEPATGPTGKPME